MSGVVLTDEQIIQIIKWDIRAKMEHVVMTRKNHASQSSKL